MARRVRPVGQIPFVGVLVLAASTLFGLGALVVELAPTLRRTSGIGADASPIAPAQ